MGFFSTIIIGGAILAANIALQNGNNTKEKIENFNKQVNKSVEKNKNKK